jgi:hypothetical protein
VAIDERPELTTETACPDCRSEVRIPPPPVDVPQALTVLHCMECGYIGIWEDEWREPTREEYRALLDDAEFSERLSLGFAWREWRYRDAQKLRTVLHSKLDRVGVSDGLVEELADEITAAGYHTHPDDNDARAMNLDRFREQL